MAPEVEVGRENHAEKEQRDDPGRSELGDGPSQGGGFGPKDFLYFIHSVAASDKDSKVIVPTAPAVSNEGPRSRVLGLLPAVSWPWVPICGSLEPPRQDGENAQKTRKNGDKMGEIRPNKCAGVGITLCSSMSRIASAVDTSVAQSRPPAEASIPMNAAILLHSARNPQRLRYLRH